MMIERSECDDGNQTCPGIGTDGCCREAASKKWILVGHHWGKTAIGKSILFLYKKTHPGCKIVVFDPQDAKNNPGRYQPL